MVKHKKNRLWANRRSEKPLGLFSSEMILPEFDQMKAEQAKLGERIDSVDKGLKDINASNSDYDEIRNLATDPHRLTRTYC